MTQDEDTAFSRPIASALLFGADADDRHRFIDKRVLLTGESDVLVGTNGAEIARAALMLLPRISRNVSVALPPGCEELKAELRKVAELASVRPTFIDGEIPYADFHAILSVGMTARADLPWTVINSNGWLVRVSSGKTSIGGGCNQANPVGALAAACLGVSEVFKRLIALREARGELLDGISFSLWTYTAATEAPGPELPSEIPINLLIVGAGAIGNGTVHLLSRLPVTGDAVIVDRQDYGDENIGTSLLISTDDINQEKARVLAKHLRSRLNVQWRKAEIADVLPELGASLPFPNIVLNGLDGIPARHEVQGLWPDLVIDGAIGSSFNCQVSCHPWGPDTACLICMFRENRRTERAESIQSRATGLSEHVLQDPNSVITEEHVLAAPEEKKQWLRAQIGKTICSITPEAVAADLSSERHRAGFEPSVPFVACFSSSMIVTELVRYVTTGQTAMEPRFQFNLLWGPQRGTDYPQARRRDCLCVQRAKNIDRVRAARG